MLNGVQNGILAYAHAVEKRAFRAKKLDRGRLVTFTLETQPLQVNWSIVTLKKCEEIDTHFNIQS